MTNNPEGHESQDQEGPTPVSTEALLEQAAKLGLQETPQMRGVRLELPGAPDIDALRTLISIYQTQSQKVVEAQPPDIQYEAAIAHLLAVAGAYATAKMAASAQEYLEDAINFATHYQRFDLVKALEQSRSLPD